MKSIKTQVLAKLNKILAQRNLKLVVSKAGLQYEFIDENSAPEEMTPFKWRSKESIRTFWPNLEVMFFKNARMFTVFECLSEVSDEYRNRHKNQNIDYYSDWAFYDLGLMALKNCSSLEEVLLKLAILFPGA